MGRGRPSKPGRRTKSGKRIAAAPFDHGAEHVQRLRARFASFQDGKAAQQVFDPIGRAWAVGLLENERIDPAVLRDAGRDYAARYWGYYPCGGGVSNYLDEDRGDGTWAGGEDPGGERFRELDARLKDAGRISYDATQGLCVDFHWFPDDNPAWLDRLINARLVAAGATAAGPPGTPGDAAIMQAALAGLLALAEGGKGAGGPIDESRCLGRAPV